MEEQHISFEMQPNPTLPVSVFESIERGMAQAKNNATISFDGFRRKHFKS